MFKYSSFVCGCIMSRFHRMMLGEEFAITDRKIIVWSILSLKPHHKISFTTCAPLGVNIFQNILRLYLSPILVSMSFPDDFLKTELHNLSICIYVFSSLANLMLCSRKCRTNEQTNKKCSQTNCFVNKTKAREEKIARLG
jgi:hypothetical protein